MIHRESTIKISRNGFQESSRRGNVLSQDNIARYQLRDEFHDSLYFYFERDAKWILSRINHEYNAAFLCKGQVTSLLIVVYLIEQDNTPIRVLERARKKEEQEGVDSSDRGTRNIRRKIRRRLRSSGRNVSKRAEEARKRFR